MLPDRAMFERSVREQIAINQARTPTERMLAFFDLLDSVRAMAPTTPEAVERRRVLFEARQRDRERMRAHLARLMATGTVDPPPGV